MDGMLPVGRFDGYIGLGYESIILPPFYNMVEQGLVDKAIFAFYLTDASADSVVTFGGVDRDHYFGRTCHNA